MTRSDFDAAEDGQRPPLVQWFPRHRRAELSVVAPKAAVAGALGAGAVAGFAVGALAVGALAIGALAIGRLVVGQARFRKLQVDELTIGSIRVLRP